MLLYNNKSIPKLTDNYLLSITDRAGNESSINVSVQVIYEPAPAGEE